MLLKEAFSDLLGFIQSDFCRENGHNRGSMGNDVCISAHSDIKYNPKGHADKHHIAHPGCILLSNGDHKQKRADTGNDIRPPGISPKRAGNVGNGKKHRNQENPLIAEPAISFSDQRNQNTVYSC